MEKINPLGFDSPEVKNLFNLLQDQVNPVEDRQNKNE